ncbi:MAG: VWA domain-containing protein [Candidatus Omnitrophica bacterium]|nr:VWA domain-containing protein [Candidatus Omnitrophota bacterium]
MIFEDFYIILLAFIIIPLLVSYYIRQQSKTQGSFRFSSVAMIKKIGPSRSLKWRHTVFVLRALAILFIIVALMRPQKGIENTKVHSEGIDIVLALDVSGSMKAEDFILNGKRYNRLYVVKEVVKDFIKKRKNDRIGLVVFAGRAYTQCPMTIDYGVLLQFFDKIDIGMIEDGTAIGDGLALAVNRLRKSEATSKVVILLTDGNNNAGKVDPLTAANLAKAMDVKVYTIGAGGKGQVPFPVKDIFGNKVYQWAFIELDDGMLRKIAEATEGLYFHGEDTKALKEVYDKIDEMETTKIELNVYMEYEELFVYLVMGALLFLLLEIILASTRFRILP